MDPIKILRELAPIRPGATRADVERLMRRDGGISSITVERWVLRSCEHVKLDLEFDNDRVKRVSKPYLETPFMD